MESSIPVSVTDFMEPAMSSYLGREIVSHMMVRGHMMTPHTWSHNTHLSACSASLALCTSSSFSVMMMASESGQNESHEASDQGW